MDFTQQLRVLQSAKDDPVKLAVATIDLAYPKESKTERDLLKESLEAAAIPHWCDEHVLSALLAIPETESARRLARMGGLKVIERFSARGSSAVNVHEKTRLVFRKRMAADKSDRFRMLSTRARAYFEDDLTPTGRIEWIYHLLCHDPELGANALEKLNRDWSSSALQDRYALATVARELDDTGLVQGRARAWVLLVTAWARVSRGEVTQLADVAGRALDLARSASDASAEADAQCLLGDVLQAQGDLTKAQAAFEESLAINRRLAKQDPSNAGWQRDLAVAHSRVGGVLQAQGDLTKAQAAFEESLAINRRLAKQDPSNAGWQRELAVAHSWVGGVLLAQGDLTKAQAAFEESLAISRRLAEQDPSNVDWQRELAVAHSRVGGVLLAQGDLTKAQAAFEESLVISRRLAEQDPSNADWQRQLAVAHSWVGGVLQAQGDLTKAQAAFEESLVISRRLAEQDPSNADWQRQLAVACWCVAQETASKDDRESVLSLYEEASRILGALVTKAPEVAQWTEDKKAVNAELEKYRSLGPSRSNLVKTPKEAY